MIGEQTVPAFMAALIGEGVTSGQIEAAVARVLDAPVGRPISGLARGPLHGGLPGPMVRAFVFEQSRLLEQV